MFERTIRAKVPEPSNGSEWLATALLEASSVDGPWKAIEAAEGGLEELSTRHAEYEDGYYRLQWHDNRNISKYSTPPVHIQETVSQARRLSVKK